MNILRGIETPVAGEHVLATLPALGPYASNAASDFALNLQQVMSLASWSTPKLRQDVLCIGSSSPSCDASAPTCSHASGRQAPSSETKISKTLSTFIT